MAYTEAELVKACLEGQTKAQRELYDRMSAKMFAMCLRYASNRAQAQDMLQDGFVQVYTDLHQFRNEGSFEGWVRRVILHVIFRALKQQKSAFTYVLDEDQMNQQVDIADDHLIGSEIAHDLIAMIQFLAPGFRTVLNMYLFEGYTHKEIATILGITEGTSKSQYMRAKIALRELYEQKSIHRSHLYK
jgi:RNA polymerase sigma factor (sigma-70 family)